MTVFERLDVIITTVVMSRNEGIIETFRFSSNQTNKKASDSPIAVMKRMNAKETFQKTRAKARDSFAWHRFEFALAAQISFKQRNEFRFYSFGLDTLSSLAGAPMAIFDAGLADLTKSASKSERRCSEDPGMDTTEDKKKLATSRRQFNLIDMVTGELVTHVHRPGQVDVFFEMKRDLATFIPGNFRQTGFRDSAKWHQPAIMLHPVHKETRPQKFTSMATRKLHLSAVDGVDRFGQVLQ